MPAGRDIKQRIELTFRGIMVVKGAASSMPTATGTAFEEYVWETWWRKNFPASAWSSTWGKALAGGYRIDFTACRGSDRAVGDAKDKACLAHADVEKVLEDAGIYKATWVYLLIAADTLVTAGIQAYADRNGVEIIRTRWRA